MTCDDASSVAGFHVIGNVLPIDKGVNSQQHRSGASQPQNREQDGPFPEGLWMNHMTRRERAAPQRQHQVVCGL